MTAVTPTAFLPEADAKRWRASDSPRGLTPQEYFVGKGASALEIAWATAATRPTFDKIRKLWRDRHRGRANPLLLVVVFEADSGERAFVCGPAADVPPVHGDFDLDRVERLCLAALDEPDRHAALRLVTALLPDVGSNVPGLRNTGLLATHELVESIPTRSDWSAARGMGRSVLHKSGRALIEGLGFDVEPLGAAASLLSVGGHPRATAVFLDEDEALDLPAERLDKTTAVTHALRLADERGVPWVITTRGRQIRLYAARADTGVGRKGRSETFVELNLAVLDPDDAGYLDLVFSGRALAADGTIEELLEHSEDFAADLGARLRDRVYREVVPPLATAVASRMRRRRRPLDDADLDNAYEQTLTVLFRLLFVAYAEDKGLLPYGTHGRYQDHALKTIARRLTDEIRADALTFDDSATDLWDDLKHLWHAIDRGNTNWGVPQYNGGLFSDEPEVNPVGSALTDLELTNAEIGPPLAALLVDTDGDVVGPVDFRTLSVRDFGTIYEGLLESGLSIATHDLTLDAKGTYVPVRSARDVVEVESGEIYFHNRSGARKATGSYFTKAFAVEHLLDHALEPAIARHLERVAALADGGDEAGAADLLFDFRCVDLAMGSGHFLVAAVDRIEARFSTFLATRPNWPAMVELERLRDKALSELRKLGENFADGVEIETSSLLRRQIARRCIYGVDRTPMAVELARLSLWVHTFVPGLPLSFLNHGLRQGNSLTGIGTIEEAVEAIDPSVDGAKRSLFVQPLLDGLEQARPALKKLGALSDFDRADIVQARKAQQQIEGDVAPVERLFDAIVAARLGEAEMPTDLNPTSLGSVRQRARATAAARQVEAFHFPTTFPEVFLRERPGFDCILGNPPWEEATVEELGFWALRFPGLRSMNPADQRRDVTRLRVERPDLVDEYELSVASAEQMRGVLLAGPYPGMGTGDPDLYKAFSWRFWQLAREAGAVGVVLPRSVLSAAGSAIWRDAVLGGGAFDDIALVLNNSGWAFDDVHPQYTFTLLTVTKGLAPIGMSRLRGPYASMLAFEGRDSSEPVEFTTDDLRSWSDGLSFPLLPTAESAAIFQKVRSHPRLDARSGWRARAATEFHATNDKNLFEFEPDDTSNLWPVYKGASFDLWSPDTGTYYAWADPDVVESALVRKRINGQRSSRSPFSDFDANWASDPTTLPCRAPRIAFRDVTNRTNSRTVIAALIPGEVVAANQAPYLLWPDGDERDQAYLLGVLSSVPLDWYARRVVETHVNFHLFNAFPIPRPERDDRLRRRVGAIAGCLAAVDARFDEWAAKAEVPVASVTDDDEKQDLIAELDAAVALLYGLDADDVRHIFETFHVGWNYEARLDSVLRHYKRLRDSAR